MGHIRFKCRIKYCFRLQGKKGKQQGYRTICNVHKNRFAKMRKFKQKREL